MYLDKLLEFGWNYGPKILTAAVMLVVGLWLIRRLTRGFEALLRARRIDASLSPFFSSLVDVALKVLLLLVVASTVGIQTTSFIALFSAIAFSIGLALQGSLGNFASGVLILLFRPYRVGDTLTVGGSTGTVAAIQIFSTILITDQGKRIIVPNGKMTEGAIENIESDAEVEAQITLLVDEGTDFAVLRRVADDVGSRCPTAVPDRPVSVNIAGLSRDDFKAEIAVTCLGRDYTATLHFMYEEFKLAFDLAGIELAKERRKEEVI